MTRDELIARIEAGEAGPGLLCAIAQIVRWRFDEGEIGSYSAETTLTHFAKTRSWNDAVDFLCIPGWLTSLDAAAALVTTMDWIMCRDGSASVADGQRSVWSRVKGNPAAALVAAWLKATA